jgi:cysteine desulfurase/selenocysteine lyase
MVGCMETAYANVHRGAYRLSEQATDAYEAARAAVARFLGAADAREVVFTRNSTEAINLVAHSYGRGVMRPDRAVLISEMEHHANIVPWQMLRDERGVELRVCRVTDTGELDLEDLSAKLADGKVGLVAVTHMSNALGTVTPAARIASLAHDAGALVLFDGSQAAVHRRVDVQEIGADFYAFTAHKLYGPTGIGVLWGRYDLLADLPPFLGGGEMIEMVRMSGSTYAPPPHRFEAGTPPIAQAVGLATAARYLGEIGLDQIAAHEREITAYALERLHEVPGLRIVGPDTPVDRGGAVSFVLDEVHPHDVAQVLDSVGVAVRAGHHCAKPVCDRFGIPATTRASFYLYTTPDEVDALVRGLDEVRKVFL